MMPDEKPAAGNAQGAGGKGDDSQNDAAGQNGQPDPMAAVKELVSRGISGGINRFQEILDKRDKAWDERFKTLATTPTAPMQTTDTKNQPDLASLQHRLKSVEDENKAMKAEQEKKELQLQERTKNAGVRGAVQRAGIRPELHDALEALLARQRLRLRDNEDLEVLVMRDGEEEAIPVDEYLKGFLATPHGKVYLPPKDAAGLPTGAVGTAGGAASTVNYTPEEMVADPKKLIAAMAAAGVRFKTNAMR